MEGPLLSCIKTVGRDDLYSRVVIDEMAYAALQVAGSSVEYGKYASGLWVTLTTLPRCFARIGFALRFGLVEITEGRDRPVKHTASSECQLYFTHLYLHVEVVTFDAEDEARATVTFPCLRAEMFLALRSSTGIIVFFPTTLPDVCMNIELISGRYSDSEAQRPQSGWAADVDPLYPNPNICSTTIPSRIICEIDKY